jgi:creatinine amidohydrolase
MPSTIRYEQLNTADFLAQGFDKVIVPVGIALRRGDHLPFGTDAYVAHDLALAVAARVKRTMVLPPTWFGMSHRYRHKPMSVSLSHDTTIALFKDVLRSVIGWGFRKVVAINGHDGNIPCLHVAAQDVKLDHPDAALALVDATVGRSLLPKRMWDAHEGYGYGGEAETSIALAMIPHLTDPARARRMVDSKDSLIKEIWNYQELTDEGATGDGRAATPEKGSRLKAAIADYIVSFIDRKERDGWVIQRQPA